MLVGVVLLVSCSGQDRAGTPTSPASQPANPLATVDATTATSAAVDVVDRYRRFWEARFAANQVPPDPNAAALREYATGQQLEQVVTETRQDLEDGLAFRHAERSVSRSSIKVIRVDGDAALLQECAVDDDIVYRFKTGEVVDSAVGTHSVEATMRKVDGVWKLASARLLQRWEGVAGCALAADS